MNILVTGAAGFIGYHVCRALLEQGHRVTGVDNLNRYYDPALKKARLARLRGDGFSFCKADICNLKKMRTIFRRGAFARVVHLAAQAGVRYSLEAPLVYQKYNNEGTLVILELCRQFGTGHLVLASSSSVYGNNAHVPFSEADRVDGPVCLYAATKRANELTASVYAGLFRIPTSALRFFTVYGPWGRPDMALFKFTRAILAGEPIDVYNEGRMIRNFTYIDDIVDGVLRVLDHPPADPSRLELYNIGNDRAEMLLDFISVLEEVLGKKAEKRLLPMQPGDVLQTVADIEKIGKLGYTPHTNIREGITRFVDWYREWYKQ